MDKPLNVVLFSHTFLPKIGGREIVVYQLGRALKDLGHQVRVVGAQGYRSTKALDYGIEVRRFPRIGLHRSLTDRLAQLVLEPQLLTHLAVDIARSGADVVHAHSLYPAGYVASKLTKLGLHRPLVVTPHGIDINTAADQNYGMRLDPTLRSKIAKTLLAADKVTAISTGVHRELLAAGVSADRLVEIGNGVDLQRFSGPAGTDVKTWLRVPYDAILILTVGNYTPLKGHEDLIAAMPAVVSEFPSAYAVIVGGATDHLMKLASALGVAENIRLPGSIPLPEFSAGHFSGTDLLADLYKTAGIYVSASNREGAEGLSLSLLDAMAAGLALVATNITGNRDVIEHGRNGLLVDPGAPQQLGSALLSFLRNTPQKERMRSAALVSAVSFGWKQIAAEYIATYVDAIQGHCGLKRAGRSK